MPLRGTWGLPRALAGCDQEFFLFFFNLRDGGCGLELPRLSQVGVDSSISAQTSTPRSAESPWRLIPPQRAKRAGL